MDDPDTSKKFRGTARDVIFGAQGKAKEALWEKLGLPGKQAWLNAQKNRKQLEEEFRRFREMSTEMDKLWRAEGPTAKTVTDAHGVEENLKQRKERQDTVACIDYVSKREAGSSNSGCRGPRNRNLQITLAQRPTHPLPPALLCASDTVLGV